MLSRGDNSDYESRRKEVRCFIEKVGAGGEDLKTDALC